MLATRSLCLSAIRLSQPTICSRWATAPLRMQPTVICYAKPRVVAYSKDAKSEGSSTVSAEGSTNPKSTAEKISESKPSPSPSVTKSASSKVSSPSSSPPIDSFQAFIQKCSTGQFKKPDIKLPSRDQVESFLFKSLVYVWDFAYYLLCMSIKLFDRYVIKNPTIQHYWKILLKRMDDARKETTSK